MISLPWCRRRTGLSVGPRRGGIGPALSGLEPSRGFLFLLLLPGAFFLTFLKGLSGLFRHWITPPMAVHLPRRPAPVPSEACASGPLGTHDRPWDHACPHGPPGTASTRQLVGPVRP